MAKDREEHFPVAATGDVNPKNYVVAVIDDQQEAWKSEDGIVPLDVVQ